MEGHAEMDMSVREEGSLWQRLRSAQGFTATARYFVMDWASVWMDVFGGLLIAGALAAWVPNSFWQSLFLSSDHTLAEFWGPLIAPFVAILSFVCSIGNVPLAAVLWNGGISFGGVLAFIFADLIVLPVLDIYRKYYGWRMAGFLLASFYATMAAAGLIVEFLFKGFGLTPTQRNAKVEMAGVQWNYTTVLNIIFLAVAAVAGALGLDAERCRNVEFGALLHDVGKIAIPNEIINKPGKLDEEEWATVKMHTIEGQRMLETVGGLTLTPLVGPDSWPFLAGQRLGVGPGLGARQPLERVPGLAFAQPNPPSPFSTSVSTAVPRL
jgi:hypothetical protein